MSIANEILMYFRSQKKQQNELSIHDTIDIDKDGNPLTYLDVISSDDNVVDDADLRIHTARMNELINEKLDEREKQILTLRYGLAGYRPMTQREVAAYLCISRSYVSRIEKRALEKLHDSFGILRPDFDD